VAPLHPRIKSGELATEPRRRPGLFIDGAVALAASPKNRANSRVAPF
jgi:hypothetical protein